MSQTDRAGGPSGHTMILMYGRPAAAATPASHLQPSGVASERLGYHRSGCSSIAPPSTWWKASDISRPW
eukprot:scaffold28924_cov59-Phaeocystis_antarctica.AAC.2